MSGYVECDCCARRFAQGDLTRCWVGGIETFACDECRGEPAAVNCNHWPGQTRCGVCGMGGGRERY